MSLQERATAQRFHLLKAIWRSHPHHLGAKLKRWDGQNDSLFIVQMPLPQLCFNPRYRYSVNEEISLAGVRMSVRPLAAIQLRAESPVKGGKMTDRADT